MQVGHQGNAEIGGLPADHVAIADLLPADVAGNVDDQVQFSRLDVLQEAGLAALVDLVQADAGDTLRFEEPRGSGSP